MRILAVDNILQRLTELEGTLRAVFPDAAVKSFTDPMLAATYGVRHNVDIIVAEIKMRRIDGFEMAGLVHKFNENINIYLLKEAEEAFDVVDCNDIAGWLIRPNIEGGLVKIATELVSSDII